MASFVSAAAGHAGGGRGPAAGRDEDGFPLGPLPGLSPNAPVGLQLRRLDRCEPAGPPRYAAPVKIEPLPEALYDAAIRLWHNSGLTRPWNDPEADLRRAVSSRSSAVLAAVGADGCLVATAMVGHDGHRGWVYYLAVDASARGRGLGRQMMEACEAWVRSQGIPKIQLMVRATNKAVVGFYLHLGYVDAEVIVLGRPLDGQAG